MRVVGLALPVVFGMTVAVTSCSSATVTVKPTGSATPSASGPTGSGSPAASPAEPISLVPVPAGYTRVGGAAQGISVAAPASWAPIDPTKENIDSAARKLGIHGLSVTTLEQDMEAVQKMHGIIVVDVKSGIDNPRHFNRNLNFFCAVSGVNNVGATGVPLLRTAAAAELQQIGATHLAQRDLDIGGVPGVETSWQVSTSGSGLLYESQLEVMPKPDKVCTVTLSVAAGESAGNILSVAAATAQFP
jgi:hypothetical protein